MRLLFVTQQVDPDHPALGATVPKIAALARRVDEVVVLADGAVPDVLPRNARVRTFGARTKAGRGARFEAALAAELPGLRGGAVVAHMCPIYAVLAVPFVRPLRIPLVLWYTHWRAGSLLRAAERVSTAVTSVDRRSFPLPSRKVRAIGHGIDLAEFGCSDHDRDGSLRLLALGRYSPAKGLDVVVHAVGATDARLTVHGPTLTPLEREHRKTLGELVDALGVTDRVRLEGAVPRARVPELFSRADLLVNNMRAGAPDKVVYEAAASCLPVVASNPVFDELLEPELRFARDDPGELVERLREFERRDDAARRELGRRLRDHVAARHSADSWAEGILAAAGLG
ncbi:MAG TPA: glycosyltransferase family 4 protein [Gaiellaceae bacterium]|jgi:glycosyltransferase involved in cell wall biosynthesis|nr:glycosyltransferase family 4 protein [Gaiellaceae bacterium]